MEVLGTRDSSKDIALHPDSDAQGIWSDGTTIWVAQWNSPRFFAYTLATGVYDPDKDFDRVPGNHFPRDVWSDGTTLYVPDHFGQKLFAYNMMAAAADASLSSLSLSGVTLSPSFTSGTTCLHGQRAEQRLVHDGDGRRPPTPTPPR